MVCIFLCLNGVEQPFSPKNRGMSEAIGSVVAAQITSNRWTLAATFKMGNGAWVQADGYGGGWSERLEKTHYR